MSQNWGSVQCTYLLSPTENTQQTNNKTDIQRDTVFSKKITKREYTVDSKKAEDGGWALGWNWRYTRWARVEIISAFYTSIETCRNLRRRKVRVVPVPTISFRICQNVESFHFKLAFPLPFLKFMYEIGNCTCYITIHGYLKYRYAYALCIHLPT